MTSVMAVIDRLGLVLMVELSHLPLEMKSKRVGLVTPGVGSKAIPLISWLTSWSTAPAVLLNIMPMYEPKLAALKSREALCSFS